MGPKVEKQLATLHGPLVVVSSVMTTLQKPVFKAERNQLVGISVRGIAEL